MRDTIRAGTLTVYTSVPDECPPAPVRDIKTSALPGQGTRVSWSPSPEDDICYYRVYRGPRPGFVPSPDSQIGSTTSIEFVDRVANPPRPTVYKVIAVDRSGDAGAVD